VRRRLKRSKNKRRNRKTHRGGFVEFGAALPCLPANSSDNSIMESIKNFDPALLKSDSIGGIKSKIKKEGAIKWSKEGELENDYGLAACRDKPLGLDKNECAYKPGGKCTNIDFDSLDKDLRKTVKDKGLDEDDIDDLIKNRGWTDTGKTNSAGQKIWNRPTDKVDAKAEFDARMLEAYRKQAQAKADYDAKDPKPTPAVTIEAGLKKWFLGVTTKV